jgi:segregation and condensation protein B
MLIEDREELSLASSGECAAAVERFLEVPLAEPLSTAALQVLAIVAYEQPVTRVDIARIRGVDSDGVVASLLARGLVAEDRRRAVRGGLLPLITTASFLQQFGLASLTGLPSLPAVAQPLFRVQRAGCGQDGQDTN